MQKDPVKITLDDKSLECAKLIADQRFSVHQKYSRPEYENTLGGHFVGACGEVAAYQLCSERARDVKGYFFDLQDEANPDIVAGDKRIEVKTWSWYAWREGCGRCVTPNQLEKYKTKRVDAVLWCHWKDDVFRKPSRCLSITEITGLNGIDIMVVDWSTLAMIEAAPIRNTSLDATVRLNHKVEDGNNLEDLFP